MVIKAGKTIWQNIGWLKKKMVGDSEEEIKRKKGSEANAQIFSNEGQIITKVFISN